MPLIDQVKGHGCGHEEQGRVAAQRGPSRSLESPARALAQILTVRQEPWSLVAYTCDCFPGSSRLHFSRVTSYPSGVGGKSGEHARRPQPADRWLAGIRGLRGVLLAGGG